MIDDLRFRDYGPPWPTRFQQPTTALQDHLPAGVTVEHVGSTAVPGLAAKDCIDILVVAPGKHLATAQQGLRASGYEERPRSFADEPRRWFWRLVENQERAAHVHLMLSGHRAADAMRAVRDLLRSDPQRREAYQELKASLAATNDHDRPAYLAGKANFMRRLTRAAIEQGPSLST